MESKRAVSAGGVVLALGLAFAWRFAAGEAVAFEQAPQLVQGLCHQVDFRVHSGAHYQAMLELGQGPAIRAMLLDPNGLFVYLNNRDALHQAMVAKHQGADPEAADQAAEDAQKPFGKLAEATIQPDSSGETPWAWLKPGEYSLVIDCPELDRLPSMALEDQNTKRLRFKLVSRRFR